LSLAYFSNLAALCLGEETNRGYREQDGNDSGEHDDLATGLNFIKHTLL
jgi:hypothetical protein